MTLLRGETDGERDAERFISRLASCSLDDWRRAAAIVARDRRAADCAQIAALVAAPETALVAWHLRDMICTCVYRFRLARVALPPREMSSITAATELTAEALLVRAVLPADTVERLVRPFAFLDGLAGSH